MLKYFYYIVLFLSFIHPISTLAGTGSSEVLGAKHVLDQLTQRTTGKPKTPRKPLTLLGRLQQYDATVDQMQPQAAADAWLTLAQQMVNRAPVAWADGPQHIDPNTQSPVNITSVLAILPKPEVWSYFKLDQIHLDEHPSNRKIKQLGLRYLAATLKGAPQSEAILTQIETLSDTLGDAIKTTTKQQLARIKTDLLMHTSATERLLTKLDQQVTNHSDEYFYGSIEVPDLVNIIGHDATVQWLTNALTTSTTPIEIIHGEATLALAQTIALAQIDALKTAHWDLIASLTAAKLYEAMQKKFGHSATRVNYSQKKARLYYFLGLVAHGQTDKAATVARNLPDKVNTYTLKKVLRHLQQQGFGARVADYLQHILSQDPTLNLWDMYIDIALYNGHEDKILRLIGEALANPTLSAPMRNKIALQHAHLQLAVGKVKQGVTGLLAHLKQNPSAHKVAQKLVNIGRLYANQTWIETGLDTLKNALPSHSQRDQERFFAYIRLLRQLGHFKAAEATILTRLQLAISRLKPLESSPQAHQMLDRIQAEKYVKQLGLELSGVYYDLKRWGDILLLADQYPYWGFADAAAFYTAKDSLKIPYGFMLAQTLAASNDPQAAINLLTLLLRRESAYDPAYALYIDLTQDAAIPYLDERYALDPFEERPLIWKAKLLAEQQDTEAALAVVKQAIAIDPSDGEQGPGDRLRAYAVYADILGTMGEPKMQKLYTQAVQAIRLSEQADQYRKAGLHADAIERYQRANERFSEAYCIQSRLAIQLTKRGQFERAGAHYKKAFELMPESFGRIESHCFGCESVFEDTRAQQIAEEVFSKYLHQGMRKAQVPYMFGYLRQTQGRYDEALTYFRQAVRMDGEYLNAWKHLYQMHEKTYLPRWELNLAAAKLLQLDPLKKHISIRIEDVTDLPMLWERANTAYVMHGDPVQKLYPLRTSEAYLNAHKHSDINNDPLGAILSQIDQTGFKAETRLKKPGMVLMSTRWLQNIVALIQPVDDYSAID